MNLCFSHVPFVTVRASKPSGGQVNICLHVLTGVEDPAVGAGGCWAQWFKRAVSSVCIFPSAPLVSTAGPSWMKTMRLSEVAPDISRDALDPHCLQTTALTIDVRTVQLCNIFRSFDYVFIFAWHKELHRRDCRIVAFLSATDRTPVPIQIASDRQ